MFIFIHCFKFSLFYFRKWLNIKDLSKKMKDGLEQSALAFEVDLVAGAETLEIINEEA